MADRDTYLTWCIGRDYSLGAHKNYIQMTAEGKGVEAAT